MYMAMSVVSASKTVASSDRLFLCVCVFVCVCCSVRSVSAGSMERVWGSWRTVCLTHTPATSAETPLVSVHLVGGEGGGFRGSVLSQVVVDMGFQDQILH